MKRLNAEQVAETLQRTLFRCVTWGQLEAAAGITDRVQWWKAHATEASAKAAITELLRERIRAGVIQ